MINYHHGNGFDFVPVYAVMALRRAASAPPAVEIWGRISASHLSVLLGKMSDNASVTLTAGRILSLEMIKVGTCGCAHVG